MSVRRSGTNVVMLAVTVISLLATGCAGRSSPAHPLVPTTVFFEDFTGLTLDSARWTVRVTGHPVNDEQQAYVDSATTIYIAHGSEAPGAVGGALVIHPRYRKGFTASDGRRFDFVSGRIDTRGKVEFTYGAVAARMKLSAGAGLWPAFWMLGTGKWPDTGEIDIMENIGDASWVSAALHGPGYFGDTPLVKRTSFPSGIDATAWHVYAVNWRQDGITFSIDGTPTYAVSRAMVEKYGRWAYDAPKFIILNFALGGTYPSAVNGVRSPYRGIPESTVQAIKSDHVTLMVDWVRATQDVPSPSR
ncbi:MAG: hypothetical protein NVS1B4_01360 [Gemmatimonadaceae bacterium]